MSETINLDYCPNCGDNAPVFDTFRRSAREPSVSIIYCQTCQFAIRRNWTNHRVAEYWNSLKRKPLDELLKKDITWKLW